LCIDIARWGALELVNPMLEFREVSLGQNKRVLAIKAIRRLRECGTDGGTEPQSLGAVTRNS
jgi:hypothetical protein